MGYNLAQKIIKDHLVTGELKSGTEISIRIDQTLTQDSTGTMAYLQFEAIGIDRVSLFTDVRFVLLFYFISGFSKFLGNRI